MVIKVKNNVFEINKFNYIKVYVMFIVTMTCIICTIKSTNSMVAVWLGYLYTSGCICSYFLYIETELMAADIISDNFFRDEGLLRVSALLDIHNFIVTVVMIIFMIAYWIYSIRCDVINDTVVFSLIFYHIISAICTALMIKVFYNFVKCRNKYDHIINGIINKRLKGL